MKCQNLLGVQRRHTNTAEAEAQASEQAVCEQMKPVTFLYAAHNAEASPKPVATVVDPELYFSPSSVRQQRGKLQADSQHRDYNVRVHPMIQVATTIISHIHDYPTLVRLAMTCSDFHAIIFGSKTALPAAFTRLELYKPAEKENYDADDERVRRALTGTSSDGMHHYSARVPNAPSWTHHWRAHWQPGYYRWIREACSIADVNSLLDSTVDWQSDVRNWVGEYDIVHLGNRNLRSGEWLPCYGCMKIKRAHTGFFWDQKTLHHFLLGCKSLQRRCVECLKDDDLRWSKQEKEGYCTSLGAHGYRILCSCCGEIQISLVLPKRHLRRSKVCSRCYHDNVAVRDQLLTRREKKIAWKEKEMEKENETESEDETVLPRGTIDAGLASTASTALVLNVASQRRRGSGFDMLHSEEA